MKVHEVVFAKHNDNNKAYLFEVSVSIPGEQLKDGEIIKVDTVHDSCEVKCFGDSFLIMDNGLDSLCKVTGAYLPLKLVFAKVEYEKKIIPLGNEWIKKCDLPF